MTFVVTLRGFTPPARFDGLPFTQARIDEGGAQAGPFTPIDTLALAPLDADPTNPASRNLTTGNATLQQGWYRVAFLDAAGDAALTAAIFSASTLALLKWDALIDVADASDYIGIDPPAAGSQDERNLYRLINGVSRSIRRYCERQFTPERGPGGVYKPNALLTDPLVLGHQRTFDYTGESMVKLRPFEPRNITAVDLLAAGSGTATPTTLAADLDYVAMPRDQTDDDTYLWLSIRDMGNASISQIMSGDPSSYNPRRGFPSWPGGYSLRVTGDWGMAAVPDDVAEACRVTIMEEWENPEGFASRAAGEISATEIVPPARAPAIATPFPQRAELLLEPYRRGPEI
jgi:hypothetical protein